MRKVEGEVYLYQTKSSAFLHSEIRYTVVELPDSGFIERQDVRSGLWFYATQFTQHEIDANMIRYAFLIVSTTICTFS